MRGVAKTLCHSSRVEGNATRSFQNWSTLVYLQKSVVVERRHSVTLLERCLKRLDATVGLKRDNTTKVIVKRFITSGKWCKKFAISSLRYFSTVVSYIVFPYTVILYIITVINLHYIVVNPRTVRSRGITVLLTCESVTTCFLKVHRVIRPTPTLSTRQ